MAYQRDLLTRPDAAAAECPGKELPPLRPGDRETVNAALDVLSGDSKKPLLARLAPFLGPAFVACVAYIDPGNFATNIQGGAKYGYTLLWVILASNLMAMFVQSLSAKLGIATGRNLAELCRQHLPQPAVWGMWGLMEIVAMATDLAEFMGAALGFHLLLGVSLTLGAVFAAIVTLAALALERYGFRPLEALIGAMVGVVAIAYVIETLLDVPDWAQIGYHAVVPAFSGTESVLVSVGILGATVMPHVIFLHSGLTQGRVVAKDHRQLKRLYRFELIDVVLAMGVAGLVNGAMLIMAAATFNRSGLVGVGTIEDAHLTLAPLLGKASSVVFALSLLASGLSSTMVGTMSGQLVMQGLLRRQVPLWLRRLITFIPPFVVIGMGLDPTRTLVVSQVILSFALPFALVPLLYFSGQKKLMGALVNSRLAKVAGALVAGLIIALNLYLLWRTFTGG